MGNNRDRVRIREITPKDSTVHHQQFRMSSWAFLVALTVVVVASHSADASDHGDDAMVVTEPADNWVEELIEATSPVEALVQGTKLPSLSRAMANVHAAQHDQHKARRAVHRAIRKHKAARKKKAAAAKAAQHKMTN